MILLTDHSVKKNRCYYVPLVKLEGVQVMLTRAYAHLTHCSGITRCIRCVRCALAFSGEQQSLSMRDKAEDCIRNAQARFADSLQARLLSVSDTSLCLILHSDGSARGQRSLKKPQSAATVFSYVIKTHDCQNASL